MNKEKHFNVLSFLKAIPWLIMSFLVAILALVIFREAFASDYVDFIWLNLGIAISILSFFLLYKFITNKIYIKILDDRIEIEYSFKFFNKTIFYDEIEAYCIDIQKTKGDINKVILIKSINSSAISLSENIYDKEKLISILINRKIYEDKNLSSSEFFFGYIILSQIVIIILVVIYHNISDIEYSPSISQDLMSIKEEIGKVKKTSSRSGTYTGLRIILKKYPDKHFYVRKKNLNENLANKIINTYKKKDSIILQIHKREYQLKINKKILPTFNEKYFFWKEIKLFAIISNNIVYSENFSFYNNTEKGKIFFDKLPKKDQDKITKDLLKYINDNNQKKGQ